MRVPNEEDTMYTAPTDDMQFLIDDVLDVGTALGELPHYADLGLGNDQKGMEGAWSTLASTW